MAIPPQIWKDCLNYRQFRPFISPVSQKIGPVQGESVLKRSSRHMLPGISYLTGQNESKHKEEKAEYMQRYEVLVKSRIADRIFDSFVQLFGYTLEDKQQAIAYRDQMRRGGCMAELRRVTLEE